MRPRNIPRRILGYFLRGLLFLLPIALTVILLVNTVRWLDSILDIGVPGLGILIALVGITLLGFIFSSFLGRTLFGILDDIMSRTPLVKIVYTSLKDLVEAFVGEKKKFNEPVLVDIVPGNVQLVGFLTRRDLSRLNMAGKVAVYLPYSYTFTGHLIIVPADRVTPLHLNSTEVMKFMVSAGVTGFHE